MKFGALLKNIIKNNKQNKSPMEKKDYVETRLADQINWYDKKSVWNKKLYYWFQSLVIILAALIPLLSGLTEDFGKSIGILIGFLGAIVAILSGLLALYKFQEKWTSYRTTSETLKHEKYLFETKTEPYDDEEFGFQLLVRRVENIISKENTDWNKYITKKQKEN